MTLQRDPYNAEVPQALDLDQLNDFLARELRRIEQSMFIYEENQTVDHLESTANVSTASVLIVDCSATAVVINLPPANRVSGKRYTFKKIDGGANKASIRAVSTHTIDGVSSSSLTAQYQVKRIVSDGINWYVI